MPSAYSSQSKAIWIDRKRRKAEVDMNIQIDFAVANWTHENHANLGPIVDYDSSTIALFPRFGSLSESESVLLLLIFRKVAIYAHRLGLMRPTGRIFEIRVPVFQDEISWSRLVAFSSALSVTHTHTPVGTRPVDL